jgi:hypothetical protein
MAGQNDVSGQFQRLQRERDMHAKAQSKNAKFLRYALSWIISWRPALRLCAFA